MTFIVRYFVKNKDVPFAIKDWSVISRLRQMEQKCGVCVLKLCQLDFQKRTL